jgi:transposase
MREPEVWVGIEVSKAPLDVALRPTEERGPVRQDAPGMALRVERLRTMPPALIVREATVGLEVPVAGALAEAGLPGVVGNPRQARDCANATGRLAQTDPLEAQGLAHVAEAVRPPPRPLPAGPAHALRAWLTRRRPWVPRLTAERRRLHRAPPRLRADIQAHLSGLERRLARTDADLAAAIRSSPLWRATDQRWQRRPGVGPGRSRTVGAEVPAWGLWHRQASAALIGVAPFTGERGTRRGTRVIWGGRAHVRAVRSLSTRSAVRHHPVLQTCDERWRAAGNAAQVAWTASLRQLLTLVTAMVTPRTCGHATTAETS